MYNKRLVCELKYSAKISVIALFGILSSGSDCSGHMTISKVL